MLKYSYLSPKSVKIQKNTLLLSLILGVAIISILTPIALSDPSIRIILHSGDTTNLAEFEDASNNNIAWITNDGTFYTEENLITGSNTAFYGTIDHAISANRTWTLPDTTATMVGTGIANQLTNTELTSGVFAKITGTGTQTQDMEFNGLNIQTIGVLTLLEQAEADADVAGEGQLWVDTQTPNKLFFTDDAGTDFDLASGSQTPITADVDYDGFNMLDGGIIKLREQAEADGDTAGAGQIWVDTQTPNKLFFTDDAGTDFDLSVGGASDFTDRERCVLEVPQSITAYPDIVSLLAEPAKISGFVLPDGATNSTINFKCDVPDNLASTPASSIKIFIMTLGAVAGPADVRLTVSTLAVADTENFNATMTAESDTVVIMPTATQTLDVYDQDLTTDPSSAEIVLGTLLRNPSHATDDFTDDILIIAIYFEVDRTAI